MSSVRTGLPTPVLTTRGEHDEFDPPTRGLGLIGKLVVFLGLTVFAAVVTDPVVTWPTLIVSVGFMIATGLPWKAVLTAARPLLPVILLLFVFSTLFYKADGAAHPYARVVLLQIVNAQYFSLAISVGGLLFAFSLVGKLLLIMAASIYLISTTPMEQLLAGLQAVRVPNAIGLMMSTAIRFIPTMNAEVATIKDAQRARGAGSSAQGRRRGQAVQGTLPLFVPMIVTSMRRADTMAMSMVSRGYGYTKARTVLTRLHVGWADYLVGLVVLALVVVFFVLRATSGLGTL